MHPMPEAIVSPLRGIPVFRQTPSKTYHQVRRFHLVEFYGVVQLILQEILWIVVAAQSSHRETTSLDFQLIQ